MESYHHGVVLLGWWVIGLIKKGLLEISNVA